MVALLLAALFSTFTPKLEVGETLPPVDLVDQSSSAVRIGYGSKSVTVLSFFYTRCPDLAICSTISAKYSWMQSRLLQREHISLVEVTLDPAHDTVNTLRSYGEYFHADAAKWHLATAGVKAISELERRFGVTIQPPTSTKISHSEVVAIIANDGTIVAEYQGTNVNPADILAEARAITGKPMPWQRKLQLWLNQNAAALCGRSNSATSSITIGSILVFLAITSVVCCRLIMQTLKL